nr:PREDICTED: crossover junction endonuclease EME1 isoform X2 [Linepithema humile]
MSSVIVLSDSDEPASPVERNGIENGSEVNGKCHFNDTNEFDFPEVPFCRETAENSGSQSDDLPDLNVNKLTHGSSHITSGSYDSEDNRVKKISRKTTAPKKDKTALKEDRRKRQQTLAQEKALKAIEKKKSKEMKPGECIKFMEVNLDQELIPNSITWRRNIEENYIDEDNEVCVRKGTQMEEFAIIIWSSYETVTHVAEDTFCASISNITTLLPNYSITLVVFGMEEYFAYLKKSSSGSNGSKGNTKGKRFEAFPIISRQRLEMCLTEVQIVAKCSSRLIENAQDLASTVYQYTKSISEIPYKLQKRENQESKFVWYVMGDNKNTVRVDKDGNGLKRLWQQQLCQFNLSSLETSEAICTAYPSPVQLIEAYKNCTPDEGINLLKDIPIRRAAGPLTAVRKIGPELSKKIYTMFTSQNGNTLLGAEI